MASIAAKCPSFAAISNDIEVINMTPVEKETFDKVSGALTPVSVTDCNGFDESSLYSITVNGYDNLSVGNAEGDEKKVGA